MVGISQSTEGEARGCRGACEGSVEIYRHFELDVANCAATTHERGRRNATSRPLATRQHAVPSAWLPKTEDV